MARNYSNTSLQTTLVGGITPGANSIQVASADGLPVSYPYSIVVDYGLATLEVMSVTGATGTSLTVIRGEDGTAAQSHGNGATVVHGVVARDLREPQQHIDATEGVHGLAAGAALVGTTSTQTLTNKTISGADNTITNIPDASLAAIAGSKVTMPLPSLNVTGATTLGGATTAAGITSSGTVQGATLTSTGAVNGATAAISGNATVGGNLTVTGTVTSAGGGSGPLGFIANNHLATTTTIYDTETVLQSITFTAVAGRRYKLTWNGNFNIDLLGYTVYWAARYQAGASLTVAGSTLIQKASWHNQWAGGAGYITPYTFMTTTGALPSGQVTIGLTVKTSAPGHNVSIQADTGTGNYQAELTLEDIGT